MTNEFNQAREDYKSSRDFIQQNYYYIWKYAYKKYSLGMKDRSTQIKSHQSNYSTGKSRSFIDVFASSLAEKPLIFTATPVGDTPTEIRDNVIQAITHVADSTKFHQTAKNILIDALKTGSFCVRVGWISKEKVVEYFEDVDGVITPRKFVQEKVEMPYAKKVDIFNIFPDPYFGQRRYVSERGVTHIKSFIEEFSALINSPDNELKHDIDHLLKNLANNSAAADKQDYGEIRTLVYQDINRTLQAQDSYYTGTKDIVAISTYQNIGDNSNVVKNLVEFIITTYEGRVVLQANGYPLYIGKNPFGFINYVTKSATNPEMSIGCEGIPYLIRGVEQTQDSFFNGYIDNARAIFNPSFTAIEGLFLKSTQQLELSAPGQVITVQESQYGHRAIERLDKGSLNDFNIMSMTDAMGQTISGVSEYDQGIAARERTATGALAVSQSSSKRISPFVGTFVDCMSEVAQMWLTLMIKFWTSEQMISVTDETGRTTLSKLKNKDLLGKVNISLEMNGMFGGMNELRYKKLMETYNTLAGSDKLQVGELIAEIMRSQGLSASKFVTDFSDTMPLNKMPEAPVEEAPAEVALEQSPSDDLGQIIQQAVNPQTDLGNE